MKCAKHNNDITDLPNKEQFGQGWLCRYAIWDSQTVNDLMLKQEVQDEYNERKASSQLDIQIDALLATSPTPEALKTFIKAIKK